MHLPRNPMTVLDQWLESLRNCVPLKEIEIKQMCEMVFPAGCNNVLGTRNFVERGQYSASSMPCNSLWGCAWPVP